MAIAYCQAPHWLVDTEHIIEYAVRNLDGDWEFRVTRPGELYPASQWARDQQALGARVLRRRIIVVDDWDEMPLEQKAQLETGE